MITRHHVALALICALILCCSGVLCDPLMMLLVVTGTLIGAVLPDIQMRRVPRLSLIRPAWYVAQFSRRVCTPLMCWLYRKILPGEFQETDKRLTHSLAGVAGISGILAALLYAPIAICGGVVLLPATTAFLEGVILGMALHLVEDLCTRKGICPFFPFNLVTIAGSIRPCDRTDSRIAYYHIQHVTVLLVLVCLGTRVFLPWDLSLPISVLGISVCTGLMVALSEINVGSGTAGPISIPLSAAGTL